MKIVSKLEGEGIFTYDIKSNKWLKTSRETPIRLYVVSKVVCLGKCIDMINYLVERLEPLLRTGIVSLSVALCRNFRKCTDREASEIFKKYKIIASPSLILTIEGKLEEKLQGSLRIEENLDNLLGKIEEYAYKLNPQVKSKIETTVKKPLKPRRFGC